jgi:hypothetical protein
MQLKPHIAISESGLIFNPETGESFVVNQIGLEILKLVKNGKSKTEIALELLSVYDVSPEQFDLDFLDFMLAMNKFRLVGQIYPGDQQ